MSDPTATAAHVAEAFRQGYESNVRFGWQCLTCGVEKYVPTLAEAEGAAHAHMTAEPWQRHGWDESHKYCVECHHEWPCDIAKAWRGGCEWAETKQRLAALHAQLGDRSQEIAPRKAVSDAV